MLLPSVHDHFVTPKFKIFKFPFSVRNLQINPPQDPHEVPSNKTPEPPTAGCFCLCSAAAAAAAAAAAGQTDYWLHGENDSCECLHVCFPQS